MKRALVTGASGFFGRYALTELVARGFEVHACARHALDRPDIHWHRIDLLEPGAVRALVEAVRPTHLLHLAWDVKPGFWTALDNIAWVASTLSLMHAFQRAGGRRWVAAGSCAEYDWNDLPALITENSPRRPATFYGVAKDSTRRLVECFANQTGLAQAWGVLFMSYGPYERQDRLVPSIIRNLIAGREAPTTAGTQVRDFLDSRDVGAAFAALLDSGVEGAVNVASGQPIALNEIVGRIGSLTGRSDLVKLGAIPMRADDPPRLVADITRLRQQVGFAPRFTLDQGLADAIAWWRQYPVGR